MTLTRLLEDRVSLKKPKNQFPIILTKKQNIIMTKFWSSLLKTKFNRIKVCLNELMIRAPIKYQRSFNYKKKKIKLTLTNRIHPEMKIKIRT